MPAPPEDNDDAPAARLLAMLMGAFRSYGMPKRRPPRLSSLLRDNATYSQRGRAA